MSIVSAIAGLLKLVNILAGMAEKRQLLNAGAAEAVARMNAATMGAIDEARKGRDAMAGDGDWADRVRDKYTRRD